MPFPLPPLISAYRLQNFCLQQTNGLLTMGPALCLTALLAISLNPQISPIGPSSFRIREGEGLESLINMAKVTRLLSG